MIILCYLPLWFRQQTFSCHISFPSRGQACPKWTHIDSKQRNNKASKRGKKKRGIRARLRQKKCKQWPLRAVILTNVCSLQSKTDNVNHLHKYKSASILAFTETWLTKDDDNVVSTPTGVLQSMSERNCESQTSSSWLCLSIFSTSPENFPTLLGSGLHLPQSQPHDSNRPHQEHPEKARINIARLPQIHLIGLQSLHP